MHARVTRFELDPENMPDAVQVALEPGLALSRSLEGCAGLIVLADREGGKGLAITLWESQDVMERSDEAAHQLTRFAAQTFHGRRPSIEKFEVVVLETRSPAPKA